MERPPSPSIDSMPSRRPSNIDSRRQGVLPHPPDVDPGREPSPVIANSATDRIRTHVDAISRILGDRNDTGTNGTSHEQSSLLWPDRSGEAHQALETEPSPPPYHAREGSAKIVDEEKSLTSPRLILLVFALGGLQLVWSVELAYGSPYLLSLGISKSVLALVWIAGPLSGTIVQPYIGIKSDQCRSKYGKRRPFIVGGAMATVASLMLLAWTREITASIVGTFGAPKDSQAAKTGAIVLAIIMIYVLDFSINVIQAAIRALVIDRAPTHQQDIANAWANRITQVGNIIGYAFGFAELPKILWFFGNTQFKDLSVIASLGIITSVTVTCLTIKERNPQLDAAPDKKGGFFGFFKDLYFTVRTLPRQIRKVCLIQIAAWIGWFPILFYSTTYVGQIYTDGKIRQNPDMSADEMDKVFADATRVGTFAMWMQAITTLVVSIALPWFVMRIYETPESEWSRGRPAVTDDAVAEEAVSTMGPRRKRLARFLARRPLEIPGLTLRKLWMLSHVLFGLLMMLTFAAKSVSAATAIVALAGIPWAVTNWVPFAIIAAEVRRSGGESTGAGGDSRIGAEKAGTILGIHNVAIAAPQIFATLVSSAIFKALQKPKGSVGDDSVAWVLRFGGFCALGAAYLTYRLDEQKKVEQEGEEAP